MEIGLRASESIERDRVDYNVRGRMEVCCIVFYVDMREKKQTVKYKQTLQHHNTGHNTVTQPTKGTNPISARVTAELFISLIASGDKVCRPPSAGGGKS